VLVTGGAGFIGSNFVRHLLAPRAPRPAVTSSLDALTYAGSRENLRDLPDPDRHQFVHGDICDRALVDRLLAEHAIDTIVHFAAESHVDRSITGPGAFVQTNVVGTFTLLEAARAAWRGRDPGSVRFHHVSTDEVYGSLAPTPRRWPRAPPTRRARRTPRPRPPRITWCAPTPPPTACRSRSRTARTTTGRTSSPRS
jgi:dTDP-glucose 4,6-dehydratase